MATVLDHILSPAKLNLFLHVTGQRDDGYHLLQSLMVHIDWCDTLHFELRNDGKIARHDLGVQLPTDDLTVRAATLMQKKYDISKGVDISIEKHIPMQAGLGGGSSNAAMTLMALNKLWNLCLPQAELHAMAIQLGADVPFFLYNGPAWVEGIGEKISPIVLPENIYQQHIAVVKPPNGVSTQQIFSSKVLTKDTKLVTITNFISDVNTKKNTGTVDLENIFAVFGFGCNDLQKAAECIEPQIKEAIDRLSQYADTTARMTGSGSAVFAPIRNKVERLEQSTNMSLPDNWLFKKCRILPAHPQTDQLAV